MRSLWLDDEGVVRIIDQRWLPHELVVEELRSVEDVFTAIREMHVRGAPLIGATAAYGVYLAARSAGQPTHSSADLATTLVPVEAAVLAAARRLRGARPTAINLARAIDVVINAITTAESPADPVEVALAAARSVVEAEVERCRMIGKVGSDVLRGIWEKKSGGSLKVLTHCNAGWLACVDYGTAAAPLFQLHDEGVPVHVWVDETRPRNQGARLTAWEFAQHGVPHTVIADNAGGLLMQRGEVDVVIVGTDRTTYAGDVVNKIGTYLKAVAAMDNGVPFYVALPSSTIDWTIRSGEDVPIEERSGEEVRFVQGLGSAGPTKVRITPEESPVANFGFDVTPSRLVTGFITERGSCGGTEEGLRSLFPEAEGLFADVA